ncbi:hypothetical protein OO015_02320 [Thermomicrobium sp. 4228-Ro]|uniref:hypothetical protein n=1 Tax=Thermomicrobium sp. 4228-Ro TaxID=2993937 RepID=UPI002248FE96|nr:hypothetical protein [Thermomicrobium sp. 4228-Ro]MCX2726327.1 hypothetical protein [Thermomicrobium sp. 4228-Ro]
MSQRRLYIWLDRDPFSGPPDLWIEDVPGRADLDLLAEAIRSGRLGRYLPTRLALSPHEFPRLPSAYRSVNVSNLLRQYRIPYRTRLEIPSPEAAEQEAAVRTSARSPEAEHDGCI